MFCEKCGKELPDNAKFCDGCGAQIGNEEAKSDFAETLKGLGNTADTTGEFDAADIEKNKVLSLFSYLGILLLIPLLAAPKSKFARFHVNQGLVLFLAEIIWGVISGCVTMIIGGVPVVGTVFAVLTKLVSLAMSVLAILGIVNACTGKAKELPVIGSFKLLK